MSNIRLNDNSKIDGYTVKHLLKTAQGVVERKTNNSVVLDVEAEARIPKFHESGTEIQTVAAARALRCVEKLLTFYPTRVLE